MRGAERRRGGLMDCDSIRSVASGRFIPAHSSPAGIAHVCLPIGTLGAARNFPASDSPNSQSR